MWTWVRKTILTVAIVTLAACADQAGEEMETTTGGSTVQAVSLLGDSLRPPAPNPDVAARQAEELAAARAAYERAPNDADAIIWLGRRTAYTGRYREAIDIYTEGIEKHSDDARLYRHRGHRHITLRRFDDAIADLEQAARLIAGQPDEVEPDGQPNALNIPTSTLQSNIWYHLGLAYYLIGDIDNARRAYRACLAVSKNNDMLVATSYWYYMTLRRAGLDAEADTILSGITPAMEIIENATYHQLLLLFKGIRTPDEVLAGPSGDATALANATAGYGVGNWHAMGGRMDQAVETWRRVLTDSRWAAFGYIAAEAEIARREG